MWQRKRLYGVWCASNSETLWTDRKLETDNEMIRGAWELGEGGYADRGGLREATTLEGTRASAPMQEALGCTSRATKTETGEK